MDLFERLRMKHSNPRGDVPASNATGTEWLRGFVGVNEEVALETNVGANEAFEKALACVAREASRALTAELGVGPQLPWWEHTNEPEPNPLEDVDDDLVLAALDAAISSLSLLCDVAGGLRDHYLHRLKLRTTTGSGDDLFDADEPF